MLSCTHRRGLFPRADENCPSHPIAAPGATSEAGRPCQCLPEPDQWCDNNKDFRPVVKDHYRLRRVHTPSCPLAPVLGGEGWGEGPRPKAPRLSRHRPSPCPLPWVHGRGLFGPMTSNRSDTHRIDTPTRVHRFYRTPLRPGMSLFITRSAKRGCNHKNLFQKRLAK